LEDDKLTANARLVLTLIIDFHHKKKGCVMFDSTISDRLGISERTVIRRRQELEKAGYIREVNGPNRRELVPTPPDSSVISGDTSDEAGDTDDEGGDTSVGSGGDTGVNDREINNPEGTREGAPARETGADKAVRIFAEELRLPRELYEEAVEIKSHTDWDPEKLNVWRDQCIDTRRDMRDPSRAKGLSPRVRGHHAPARTARITPGSIPACAGASLMGGTISSTVEVYPRVCGGIWPQPPEEGMVTGLSPRVRGHQLEVRSYGRNSRSIPACAGASCRSSGKARKMKVYPRVCGGIPPVSFLTSPNMGLSPRVRGHLEEDRRVIEETRSIPACAGASKARSALGNIFRVYPRVCGGIRYTTELGTEQLGLSPRVRGHL